MKLIVDYAKSHTSTWIWGSDDEMNKVRFEYRRYCLKVFSDLPEWKVEKTHNFRKTRMMLLKNANVDVAAIKQLVGHRSIETTFKYLEIP